MLSFINKKVAVFVLIFILIVGLFSFGALAQGKVLYDSTNGLVSTNVNDACQTEDGYIWIAQYEGLTRYDGKEFVNINHVIIGKEDVSLEQLTNVESDSKNRLYIGTKNSGLIIYEDGEYRFLDEKSGKNINDIFVKNNIAYVATTDGAYIYKNGAVTWLKDTVGKAVLSISALSEFDIYYVDSNGAALRYDGNTKTVYNEGKIKTVRVFSNTVYLGGMYGDLVCIGEKSNNYKVTDNSPINALTIQDGNIYIGSDDGIFMLSEGIVTRLNNLNPGTTVNNIFFDYEKSLWVSTVNGLAEFHQFAIENLFDTYGIAGKSVNACYCYKNLLFVGTDSGLIIIDEANSKIIDNELVRMLENIRIRDFEEFEGKLYIATYSSEQYDVIIYDGAKFQFLYAKDMMDAEQNENAIFAHSQIRCFAVNGNNLIIGTNYGLSIKSNGSFKTVKMANRPLSISAYDDKCYVCTDGDGIHIFDYEANEIETVKGTEETTILRTIRYKNGLLFGMGSGLFYSENGSKKRLNLESTGSIVDLRECQDLLVIYTSSGVYYVDKNSLLSETVSIIRKFNGSNGLESGVTANGKSFYSSNTDTYYFNCLNSVYKYSMSSQTEKNGCLKMAVSNISVDGVSIPLNDSITLSKSANRIEFDLAVLTYLDRDNLIVHYQMQGIDKEMCEIDFSKKQTIEYTSMPGGYYTLNIYTQNVNGLESNKITVSIHKSLKWYERTVERICMILIFIAIIAVLMRIHVYRKTKKMRDQSELRKRMAWEALEAIANTIDAKDDYTKGHSVRVAKLSVCIGKHMHMTEDELEALYYIGLMHDVGKIGIPDNILTKPGRLTDEEFAVMKQHPTIGHAILHSIKSIPNLEAGVNYHHEKYDGTGYPKGLKGEEIPLIGKIICCADCYDAMASRRCYKPSMEDERIIAEFEKCEGTQFDPQIAKIAIECIENGEFRAIVDADYNISEEN